MNQEYRNVTPTAIVAAGAVPSTYSFGTPAITAAVTTELHQRGGANTQILGALYYTGATPADYQYGISETGKPGETFLECANRGLIEELGLEFAGIPMPFRHFVKTPRNKVQTCKIYIVHASEVRAATVVSCRPVAARMNAPDPLPVAGTTHENKTQVIVYGSSAELMALGVSIQLKPVKPVSREFYDAPIKGFVIRPA
jgi:hypothetical protein